MKQKILKVVNIINNIFLLFFYYIIFNSPLDFEDANIYQIIVIVIIFIINYIYSKLLNFSKTKCIIKFYIIYTIAFFLGLIGHSIKYNTSLLQDYIGLFFSLILYIYGVLIIIILFFIILLWQYIIGCFNKKKKF